MDASEQVLTAITEPDPSATPIERLVAFAGRQP